MPSRSGFPNPVPSHQAVPIPKNPRAETSKTTMCLIEVNEQPYTLRICESTAKRSRSRAPAKPQGHRVGARCRSSLIDPGCACEKGTVIISIPFQ